ncbi:unnamed protein product [Ranitomeya imitator]|uniref:Ribosome-releasing factor 2, mitochondrial n=1 Tax=Ranitomeya imitator TaxID=111125 RepID=A0ABN9LEQ1_9NEOB|nr:unnamed protein product [Ranitomeya imitator]
MHRPDIPTHVVKIVHNVGSGCSFSTHPPLPNLCPGEEGAELRPRMRSQKWRMRRTKKRFIERFFVPTVRQNTTDPVHDGRDVWPSVTIRRQYKSMGKKRILRAHLQDPFLVQNDGLRRNAKRRNVSLATAAYTHGYLCPPMKAPRKILWERMSRLLLPFADQQVEISSLPPGNIALTVGLKQTATGDTIVSSKASASAAAHRAGRTGEKSKDKSLDDFVLAGVEIPEPVFFCTIEPPFCSQTARSLHLALHSPPSVFSSSLHLSDLENALKCLQLEDPSLKVKIDPDSGQFILCGMGELHIEIIHDRIRREYGLETYLGPLQVAYRETIVSGSRASDTLDRTMGDTRHQVTVELEVRPLFDDSPVIEYSGNLPSNTDSYKEAVENGIHSSYLSGPLLGFPLQDVGVIVHEVNVLPGTSMTMVSACVSRCMQKAIKAAGKQILEPMMRLEITMGEDYLSSVLADLSQRRGNVQEIQDRLDNKVVIALAPLAELMGYSTDLRSVTSGNATFTLELSNYEAMNSQDQNSLLRKKGLL